MIDKQEDTVHNAEEMGASDGYRHYMQVFNLKRIYFNKWATKLYLTTEYRSVSTMGRKITKQVIWFPGAAARLMKHSAQRLPNVRVTVTINCTKRTDYGYALNA